MEAKEEDQILLYVRRSEQQEAKARNEVFGNWQSNFILRLPRILDKLLMRCMASISLEGPHS